MVLAVALPDLFKKRIIKLEKKAIEADEQNLSLFNEILNGLETIVNFAKERLFIGRFRRSTALSVSYTHLDVYKRQLMYVQSRDILAIKNNMPLSRPLYTHNDLGKA